MKKLIIAGLLVVSSCTAPDKSREALIKAGFSEITLNGWAPLSCSEDDNYKTKFTATNPAGVRVDGTVCCGVFKGCTIRL